MSRPAALLDRDGTLNVKAAEHEYVTSPEDFVWLPGAAAGAARLARAGYVLAVVSNQRGVARGLVTRVTLDAIERRIQRDLASRGCSIEAFRYCFHDTLDACECRKPKPGLLVDLAAALDLDLARSWMIGDAESDVHAGIAAGCRTARVGATAHSDADLVAASLAEASELILAGTVGQRASAERASASKPSTSA